MKGLLKIFKDGRWLITIFPVAILVIAVLTMTGIMNPIVSFGCGIIAYFVAMAFSYDEDDEDWFRSSLLFAKFSYIIMKIKPLYFKEVTIMARTYSEWRKSEEYKAWERKQKRLNAFVYRPIRIVIFPIVLLVRLYQWTYRKEDWGLS